MGRTSGSPSCAPLSTHQHDAFGALGDRLLLSSLPQACRRTSLLPSYLPFAAVATLAFRAAFLADISCSIMGILYDGRLHYALACTLHLETSPPASRWQTSARALQVSRRHIHRLWACVVLTSPLRARTGGSGRALSQPAPAALPCHSAPLPRGTAAAPGLAYVALATTPGMPHAPASVVHISIPTGRGLYSALYHQCPSTRQQNMGDTAATCPFTHLPFLRPSAARNVPRVQTPLPYTPRQCSANLLGLPCRRLSGGRTDACHATPIPPFYRWLPWYILTGGGGMLCLHSCDAVAHSGLGKLPATFCGPRPTPHPCAPHHPSFYARLPRARTARCKHQHR